MEAIRAKTVAAAVAAVVQCIGETEVSTPPALEVSPLPPAESGTAVWGLAGRQDSMSYRVLWQRRLSKSW
jgi:hypothetical protein